MTIAATIVPLSVHEVRQGRLLWRPGLREEPCPPGLLGAFCQLENASDEVIGDFARRHGALELCTDHRLPQSHRQIALGEQAVGCRPARAKGGEFFYVEDLSDWRHFAKEAGLLLSVASRVQAGDETHEDFVRLREVIEPLSETDRAWSDAVRPSLEVTFDAFFTIAAPESDEDYAYRLLHWIGDRWFRLGDVRPTLFLDDEGRIDSKLTAAGLFGTLAVLLAAELTRTLEARTRPRQFELAICHECGQLYVPRRKPAANRRNYCDRSECKRAALRDAQRDKRAGKSKPQARSQRVSTKL